MKYSYLLAVILLLTGCRNSSTSVPDRQPSFWYRAGFQDASAGLAIKDNETLAEWFGDVSIDRPAYQRGYVAGQQAMCRHDKLQELSLAGKDYPASCNSVENAEQLRRQWQADIDRYHALPR
ncbi:DUF2799 domain-containing protein [Affinibrenneria salicis]|uniref:DUF2799 domain-containing protein n=1 Tax=Affinibrenneria salicis TaxID=2590031 RepID=A0A5J5FSD7_9GAMM|nr:DUF2799 domain-containing protein [Affinibrenneria salicis]KAA8996201.1 DUF2799 domain-containing protein [Affinibrenneria salicis]